jgi:hypothetical protein
MAENVLDFVSYIRSEFLKAVDRNRFALKSGCQTLANVFQDKKDERLGSILSQCVELFPKQFQFRLAEARQEC